MQRLQGPDARDDGEAEEVQSWERNPWAPSGESSPQSSFREPPTIRHGEYGDHDRSYGDSEVSTDEDSYYYGRDSERSASSSLPGDAPIWELISRLLAQRDQPPPPPPPPMPMEQQHHQDEGTTVGATVVGATAAASSNSMGSRTEWT